MGALLLFFSWAPGPYTGPAGEEAWMLLKLWRAMGLTWILEIRWMCIFYVSKLILVYLWVYCRSHTDLYSWPFVCLCVNLHANIPQCIQWPPYSCIALCMWQHDHCGVSAGLSCQDQFLRQGMQCVSYFSSSLFFMMHDAVRLNRYKIAKLLIAAGADTNIKNHVHFFSSDLCVWSSLMIMSKEMYWLYCKIGC